GRKDLHTGDHGAVRRDGERRRPGRGMPGRTPVRDAVFSRIQRSFTMIRVSNLKKSFGEVKAVDGVSFEAPDGRITGMLGPNGAGKSTTLRVLYTVLKPDAGSAHIDGADVVTESLEARRRIG